MIKKILLAGALLASFPAFAVVTAPSDGEKITSRSTIVECDTDSPIYWMRAYDDGVLMSESGTLNDCRWQMQLPGDGSQIGINIYFGEDNNNWKTNTESIVFTSMAEEELLDDATIQAATFDSGMPNNHCTWDAAPEPELPPGINASGLPEGMDINDFIGLGDQPEENPPIYLSCSAECRPDQIAINAQAYGFAYSLGAGSERITLDFEYYRDQQNPNIMHAIEIDGPETAEYFQGVDANNETQGVGANYDIFVEVACASS